MQSCCRIIQEVASRCTGRNEGLLHNLDMYANRGMEVMANRLRFGRCRLNAYLQQIGRQETGLCDSCGVPETVSHYVMDCTNDVTKEVKAHRQRHRQEHTLANVLSNGEILRIICQVNTRCL